MPKRETGDRRLEHPLGELLSVLLRHERPELLGVRVKGLGHLDQSLVA
jgi:hypothetical protein